MKQGYLKNTIDTLNLDYTIIESKAHLLEMLDKLSYDVLVSNGCQYILPISKLQKAKYVNIHPSFLPDLKGRDPINGAILFRKDSGATCHIMDDLIDNGDVIEQLKIPYTEDLDSALLYQLCFLAEAECFNRAYKRNFEASIVQKESDEYIYYSYSLQDRVLDFSATLTEIFDKIKAYNTKSKGCYFKVGKHILKVYEAKIISNTFVQDFYKDRNELELLLKYEGGILFKNNGEFIRFSVLNGNLDVVREGDKISNCADDDFNTLEGC
ncbi:formyltransferase family protein [Lentimicrobium sp. S6]|uniref:formyltransferase family protein n=1 Tax=Lentimicrobium sp. S6 TaxID=2735872 RepID=UPI0015531919|nr:formyltransferase family protein [Lentimicrobium sp. S6]NPD46743.1 hypothetical protein [Lentimicrobium sp. S6]